MSRLTFDEVCKRKTVAEVPLAWVVLYEVASRAADTVKTDGMEDTARQLAVQVCDFMKAVDAPCNAVVVHALLLILQAYLSLALDTGAVRVFDLWGGDKTCPATSLN